MTEKERDILTGDFFNSLPHTVNLKNLLGNEVFIEWFLPRLKVIKEIQRWPTEKIKQLTEIKLRTLFSYLNNNSAFWNSYFSKYEVNFVSTNLLSELNKLPIINKASLIEWGDSFLVINNVLPNTDYYTSGTTGIPLRVKINEFECIKNELAYAFEPDAFGSQRIDDLLRRKFILLLGRKSTGQYTPYSEYLPLDSDNPLSNTEVRKKIYNNIMDNSLVNLFAYSSVILELMKYAREDGVALPVIAHLSGEAVSSEEEKFIYETTGIPIIFSYNCREAGKVGEKCPFNIGSNLYHIYRERVLVEIVDDEGKVLNSNVEGNIVLTVLDRTVTPIIRYSTGDKGRILSGLCACGRLSPRLELQGRQKDFIILPDGKTFSVLLFRTLFVKEIGLENIAKYQIIQKAEDYIQINYISRKQINFEKIKNIKAILEGTLGNKVIVGFQKISDVENYKSGKSQVFVSVEQYKNRK